jgi:virginiamycin B lyase
MHHGSRPLFPILVFPLLVFAGCGDSGSSGGASGGTGGSGAGGSNVSTGGSAGSATGGTPGSADGAAGGSPGGADAGPPPTTAPSTLKVVEWKIPRAGAFPHDPAVDGKGVSWWTDQSNSYIGRWDPVSGATMDWPTPTPACGPHGLVPDDQDHIWYTGQRCNKIGRLDPATGMITEYDAMGDPHTPAFHKGMLWFTMQSASKYGRVNPADGTVQAWPTPTPAAGPYGLWPAPDGTLWMALFNTNKVAQLDPANPVTLREVTLPNGGARPRRIAVDSVGHVYYTDYARGFLGRFDPATMQFKEWPSPAGANSDPYGITVGPDKRIYYGESGADTIVAFDPASEKMEVIAIPTKGSVVRNMATDMVRRRVWLSLSGQNRMAYIDVPATPAIN